MEPTTTTDTHAHVARLTASVEEALQALPLPMEPSGLYDPIRYVLEGGGKRMRPLLVLLAAEVFGGQDGSARALPAAVAVEVFHNFTLVHDDIMDAAEERRGRPTVHTKWDDATAILAGDLMMALAYDQLNTVQGCRPGELFHIFHRMVTRLCEGQSLDTAFEQRDDVTVPEYLDMIERKTGALLEACLELGGVIGGATAVQQERLRTAGCELGRAFQIQDDLLDLTAESAGWGKTIGGDLLVAKRTFLLLRALERSESDEHAWFQRILNDQGLDPTLVPEARARMERLGVLDEARSAISEHYAKGMDALMSLPSGAASDALHLLASSLLQRVR